MSAPAAGDTTAPMGPPPEARDLRGQRLDRYQVVARLGRGGMSDVYLALDRHRRRRVALKATCHPDGAAHLVVEAAALARVVHPHVIAAHELAHVGAHSYLILELVEGLALDRWLDGAPTWACVVDAFAQAARGLAAAHAAGVVHRDVKPANLLRDHTGRVRVADFGVAIVPGLPRLDGLRVGTARYMAPEQHDGHADARADQFGLGVSLFEALYGFHPYGEPATLDGSVAPMIPAGGAPAWVGEAVLRAIALDPARRWPSMGALAEALAAPLHARGEQRLALLER